MMMPEPKCVYWKRLGAEQVQKHLKGLTLEEEVAFWRMQTDRLKEMGQNASEQSIGSGRNSVHNAQSS